MITAVIEDLEITPDGTMPPATDETTCGDAATWIASLTNAKKLDDVCKDHNVPLRFESKRIKIMRLIKTLVESQA